MSFDERVTRRKNSYLPIKKRDCVKEPRSQGRGQSLLWGKKLFFPCETGAGREEGRGLKMEESRTITQRGKSISQVRMRESSEISQGETGKISLRSDLPVFGGADRPGGKALAGGEGVGIERKEVNSPIQCEGRQKSGGKGGKKRTLRSLGGRGGGS